MTTTRRYVLAALVAAFAALAAVILLDVLATTFFAVTVAYLLVPLHDRLETRVSPWWASAATTAIATAAVLVPLAVVGYFLSERVGALVAFLRSLPRSVTVDLFGARSVVDAADVLRAAQQYLSGLAVDAASALPVLAVKLTLFAFLVFALLLGRHDAGRALLAPIPDDYHDVVRALHERTRDTLFAIYVLQAATAAATAAIAYLVFWALGYPFAATLALLAGVLQFLPVVGPSVLVLALAAYQASVGDTVAAAAVLAVGGVLVAWLPDVLVRPRLARETARIPGSLYFVGFTGGLLTLGPVGVIAGPLVVALLVEAVDLLAADVNHVESEPS